MTAKILPKQALLQFTLSNMASLLRHVSLQRYRLKTSASISSTMVSLAILPLMTPVPGHPKKYIPIPG